MDQYSNVDYYTREIQQISALIKEEETKLKAQEQRVQFYESKANEIIKFLKTLENRSASLGFGDANTRNLQRYRENEGKLSEVMVYLNKERSQYNSIIHQINELIRRRDFAVSQRNSLIVGQRNEMMIMQLMHQQNQMLRIMQEKGIMDGTFSEVQEIEGDVPLLITQR